MVTRIKSLTVFNEHSVFGENCKYIFAIAFLAAAVYSNGAVQDALAQTSSSAPLSPVSGESRGDSGDRLRAWHREGDGLIASSTVSTIRPLRDLRGPVASSTRPDGIRQDGEHPLAPEEVIMILYKNGIIDESKLVEARAIFAASSTRSMGLKDMHDIQDPQRLTASSTHQR